MHTLLRLLLESTLSPEASIWLVLLVEVIALATIPSVLVRRQGRPLAALSWILALLTIPIGGVLCWWLFGHTHLRRNIRKRQAASAKICEACPPPVGSVKDLPADLRHMLPFALQGRRWSEGVFPPALGTDIRLLTEGRDAFSEMEKAIIGARYEIRALFYIWQIDETGERLVEHLTERARAGVKVRVLVDAFGSRHFLKTLAKRLLQAGAEVECFVSHFWTPTWNFRNHRKLLLVDAEVALTGGMNIGKEYEGEWRDLMIRVRGAIVRNLDDVFREDWGYACGKTLNEIEGKLISEKNDHTGLFTVVASGPDRSKNRLHDGFFLSICGAQERLWLTSPYFIPSSAIAAALRGAAQRGVDVRLLLPSRRTFDILGLAAHSYLHDLLSEGVRLFEYLPRFLHTKSLVIDDHLVFMGSANADSRSFRLNFELGCFIQSRYVNDTLSNRFVSDLQESVEIQPGALADQPTWKTCLESAAHLMSPLL